MPKRLVNGVEVDLPPSEATLHRLSDRMIVGTPEGSSSAVAVRKGDVVYVSYQGRQYAIEPVKANRGSASKANSGDLISPMPGQVVDVLVSLGELVVKGQKIVLLEAMKTQQSFEAPFDGKIMKLTVSKGEQVSEGAVMAVVEPAEDKG